MDFLVIPIVYLLLVLVTAWAAQKTNWFNAPNRRAGTWMIFGGIAVVLGALMLLANFSLIPAIHRRIMQNEQLAMAQGRLSQQVNLHKKVAEDPEKKTESFVHVLSFNPVLNVGYMLKLELFQDGNLIRLVEGDQIEWNEAHHNWRVNYVTIREFHEDGTETLSQTGFLDTTFYLIPEDFIIEQLNANCMTLPELNYAIEQETSRGSGLQEYFVLEKQTRTAHAASLAILALFVPLIHTRKIKGGVLLHLGIAVLFLSQFLALQYLSFSMMGEGFPLWPKVWLPNVVCFLLAAVALPIARK